MSPVSTKQEVMTVLSQNQERICALGVRRIGLFGSFVREQQASESDVDLLVEFGEGKKTFDNFMELSFLLEQALQRRVELITPDGLSPYIGPHILSEVEYASLAV
ncbi:MAG: nucleotidyltransferase family protein [Acidobacteria bacterium]|nr:nucleotidyltransferase family protein [Acidobacteriota bacterium]MCI0624495.1 nucleotidyltransferase family protein [Acidobacteriota bacterium]MCI0722325.1 nucleotidyltransferase family protein [Acidobacteriota bacterium]